MGLTKYILPFLLLPNLLFAEVSAVIDGPTSAIPGDLVVLDGTKSIGEGHRWIFPSGIQTLACGESGPGQIAFASGKSGSYTFTLIVADKEAAIDYTTHTVVISTSTNPIPPDPPDTPDPTPVPELEKLERLSLESASRLADAGTAKALAVAIESTDRQISAMCSNNQCPGLNTAKTMMVRAIENVLLIRKGTSADVFWAKGWREPVNAAIDALKITDVPTYQAAMRALAAGLSKAAT
jgi:hypothetical protein